MKKVVLSHFCVLAWAGVTGLAACSDSTAAPSGGTGEATAATAQTLTSDGWAKLDANLRVETVASARTSEMRAMFVQSNDPEATRRIVEAAGGVVGTIAGDVMTVRVPVDALPAIANATNVQRLEAARAVHKKLDKAITAMKADKVHSGAAPLATPYKGKGVLVGVIDYGMDFGHAAFRRDGKTRLRGLWDQSLTGGTAPAGFKYGVECTAAQIDAKTCPHKGDNTHGTHVMGVAAGGPVDGVPYVGIAPESDIAYVELGNAPGIDNPDEASNTAICDGANYIFKVGAAANLPTVVNMSLGEHTGPHDGTSLADRCLDNLSGPGKIIVAAAGNEGQGTTNPAHGRAVVHATGTASATPTHLKWYTQPSGKEKAFFWVDSKTTLSVKVGFEHAGHTTYSDAITFDHPVAEKMLSLDGITVGPVSGAGGAIPAGSRSISIDLKDKDGDKQEAAQTWIFEITGDGRFDAFIDTTSSGGFAADGQAPGVTVDSAMTIGFPAIAKSVIAVASYTTRNAWKSADGSEHVRNDNITGEQVVLGALSGFSSRGPARGVSMMKPDIAAPGERIIAALNSNSKVGGGASALGTRGDDDVKDVIKASPNGYMVMHGTSMASPAVAGVVALMLQKNPNLTSDDVRGIFDRTAVKPEGVANPQSTDWGRGKVDAFAAVVATTPGTKPAPGADAGTGNPDNGGGGSSKKDSGCQVAGTGGLGAGFGAGLLALASIVLRRRRREQQS